MRNYLTNLIEEKGRSLTDECEAKDHHKTIRATLVKIDFCNGDVFHYLDHLAAGMVAACGY
jgi:hypothetical protein